jgi:hypothetical protein
MLNRTSGSREQSLVWRDTRRESRRRAFRICPARTGAGCGRRLVRDRESGLDLKAMRTTN